MNNIQLTKAIIPLAGLGTRMYPFTNSIPKSFIPIVKDNQFKPIFQILVEELLEAGIKKIALVINKSQEKFYSDFFKKLNNDIEKHIKYYYQEKQLGLGDAILCAKDFIRDEPFMLVLGDQIYKSFDSRSCTKQLIDTYNSINNNIISVMKEELNNIEKYGVFIGEKPQNRVYKITKILEKPSIEEAKKYNNKKSDYYIAFGEYILDKKIIKKLEEYKNNNPDKEIPFTEFLDEVYDELYCYIENGIMYDVGNINSYLNTIKELYQ